MRLSGPERVVEHRHSGRAHKLQDAASERLEATVFVQRIPGARTWQIDGNFLEHLPLGEYNDAVAEEHRFGNVVGDEEYGRALLLPDARQLLLQGHACLCIDAREGL